MIEIPVHNQAGEQVGSVSVDEALLGGAVRPALLKQAYVRQHANRRQGTVRTKDRSDMNLSGRKLYRQKGTGNARRGDLTANLLKGGAHGHAKRPKSWRQRMPRQMRRLANRNALLAKVVDGEVKVVDGLSLDKPSTKQFTKIMEAVGIDRSCLLALPDTRDNPLALSTRNIPEITLTQIDRLNAFELLNHRYVMVEREAFEAYLGRLREQMDGKKEVA